jgi:hypothetical protein
MKKILIIAGVILLIAAILCVPIKSQFREGGTTFYSALLYRVIEWNVLQPDLTKITGRDVYFFPNNFREYDYYYEQRTGQKPIEHPPEENVTPLALDKTMEIPAKPMVYYADLTHNGTDEKIVVDISKLETESGWVSVFDSDENLLWKGAVHLSHAGNGGIYLYKEHDYAYLMTWNPWFGQGRASLGYEIFSLNASGEALVYRSGNGAFTLEHEMSADQNGKLDEANLFMQDVNRYLERSILLARTTTEGVRYSTPDNLITETEPSIDLDSLY